MSREGGRDGDGRSGAEGDALARFRGTLFSKLDRLAFALELEAAEAVDHGDGAAAARLEDRRLGIRLAQRLVSGVHADEVDLRLERAGPEYDDRTGGFSDRASRP